MEQRKSEALVLKSTPYLEKDFITVFLTKEFGKKTGRLRGARSLHSPYRGMGEPFIRMSLQFNEKESSNIVSIRSADLLESHQALRKQYNAFLHASYFTELLLHCIIPENESYSYYALLNKVFLELCADQRLSHEQRHEVVRLNFELSLLFLLGVFPQLEHCVICSRQIWRKEKERPVLNRKESHFFDVLQGGLRCHECSNGLWGLIQLKPGTIFYLIQWLKSQLNSQPMGIFPTRRNFIDLEILTCTCLRHHLHRFPKSHALLRRK